MLYRFIFKILKELAETQQDLEITRSSNMTILTLLLEKKICSKEEYVSTFNEIQSKNMENINQIKNKIHEIEEQFIEVNKNIKEIVNTDTAIINCGAYGKGRIYNLEMSVENESNS
jgi:hypothetical protein